MRSQRLQRSQSLAGLQSRSLRNNWGRNREAAFRLPRDRSRTKSLTVPFGTRNRNS
jgi:hypothetical protein